MRSPATPWLILALVLASALFLRTDSPAFAQPATVYPASSVPVPFRGLRNVGVTLTSAITISQTMNIPISATGRLRVGQIVETQDTSKEIMEITAVGGSMINANRGVLGTSAASHNSGTALYSDFTAVDVNGSGVGYRDTGATLSAALDTTTLENSGAFLTQSIDTVVTTVEITDATLLTDATAVRIDGTAYVSTTNTSFLGSTGRVPMAAFNTVAGDSITFGYATLPPGPPPGPNGPSGNGILAEVRLRAEHLGTVSLDLQDVVLAKADGWGTPIPVGEVVDGSATVVSGSPSPPSPPSPNCGGTGVKVCVLPSTQNVGLGNEFTAYVAVQNVTNLGAYQFTLKWSPATEEMTVQSVHRGYLKDDGSGYSRNANLSADIGTSTTNVPLVQVGQLEAGWTALMKNSSEEMLILAVNAGPPASMTVIRGYNGTTPTAHYSGDWIWAGPERMNVTRAALPAPHNGGADFRTNLRVLRVSDHTLLSASALQIDSEWFKVAEIPARTFRDTGRTLSTGGVDATATLLSTTGSGSVQKGWILQIDNELMPVTSKTSSTVTVVRGYFGSQAAPHLAGASLKATYSESNTVRALRGFQGTTIASHSAGAAIRDVDGLGGYGFTLGSPGVPTVIDFVWANNGPFLGQSGRTPECVPPSGDITFQCDTTGALPLGPTGSGTLTTVDVTGKQKLPSAPSQSLALSGVTLHDVSGDTISVGTAGGSVKVVGCPDFDDNRVVQLQDVVIIARAALIGPPSYPTEPEQNLNNDGAINLSDVVIAAQVAMASEPQPLRCPPVDV